MYVVAEEINDIAFCSIFFGSIVLPIRTKAFRKLLKLASSMTDDDHARDFSTINFGSVSALLAKLLRFLRNSIFTNLIFVGDVCENRAWQRLLPSIVVVAAWRKSLPYRFIIIWVISIKNVLRKSNKDDENNIYIVSKYEEYYYYLICSLHMLDIRERFDAYVGPTFLYKPETALPEMRVAQTIFRSCSRLIFGRYTIERRKNRQSVSPQTIVFWDFLYERDREMRCWHLALSRRTRKKSYIVTTHQQEQAIPQSRRLPSFRSMFSILRPFNQSKVLKSTARRFKKGRPYQVASNNNLYN